ncbi:MAG: stage II sporulation protein M [Paenibacillaceae bacterium]|nr:stage II sporulation protein M [Paenibacillaceae bacterium]
MQRQTVALLSFVFVLFLTGVACGALLVRGLNDVQQRDVSAYVERHVRSFLPEHTQERVPFVWEQRVRVYVQWLVVIALCGVSVVCIPIVCMLIFVKGVMVGFALAVLIAKWSWAGVVVGICSVFPHHIVLLPVLCAAGAVALATALALVRKLMDHTVRVHRYVVQRWLLVHGGCLAAIVLAAWIETKITPIVMQSVVPWALGL